MPAPGRLNWVLAVAVSLAGGCSGRREAPPPAEAPGLDVVLVTVDTLRADAPGFSGNGRVKTPAMDGLAAAGRVFTNAHAHSVVTLPSHSNILSGFLPFTHGVRDNAGSRFPRDLPTLASRLKAVGYATGAFVAAFPLDRRFGLDSGFDVYDDHYGKGDDSGSFKLSERPGPEVVSAALDWYSRQVPGKRFLWVHLFEPHAPYAPPEPFRTEYQSAPYLGEVAAADAALGPLLSPLRAAPSRTLVILTADHGESLGEHGEATHGLFAYESTLHVPLVVFGSRTASGRDGRAVSHVDLVPTVLDAVGVPADPKLPGRSLLAADDRTATVTYFEALSASLNRGWAPLTGVLRGGLKYVDLPIRELYDIAKDPGETRDLSSERDADVRALKRLLPEEALRPPTRSVPGSEEAARLRSLGYVTSTSGPATKVHGPEDDPKRLVSVDQSIHRLIDLYQRGRLPEAIAAAEALVREKPTLAVAVEQLAFLYQQADRLPDAARVLQGFIARRPAGPDLVTRLGLVLSEMGRAREAVKVLEPLSTSEDPEVLNALGIALADAGELDRAKAVFGRALEVDPENPLTFQNRGIVELRQERAGDARDSFRKALAMNGRLTRALNGLGAAEARLGNIDAALAAWERLVALDPGDLDALFNMGVAAARGNRPDQARSALSRFLTAAPPARYSRERAQARALLSGGADGR